MKIIYSALNNSKMCNNTMEFGSIIYNNKSTYTDLRYFFKNSWQAIYILLPFFFYQNTNSLASNDFSVLHIVVYNPKIRLFFFKGEQNLLLN